MAAESTDRTPLLHDKNPHGDCPGCLLARRKIESKEIPRKQLVLVAFLVLCAALPISSLFPFIYFMVRDLGIAESDTDIGTYAGYIGSAFMFGRCLTSTPWGMFSDKFGRKPVMVIGTAATIVFNTLFGFSSTYWVALLSRFLLGFCNGTLGTVRAYVSEICIEEHQALGLSVVGTMWGLGLIIGPAIGGYLALPNEKYPTLFPSGSLFDQFPYALPCLCISFFSVVGVLVLFWLPETAHNHAILVPSQVPDQPVNKSNSNGGKEEYLVEISQEDNVKTANVAIWRNRPMIAAISLYCIWGLHDMAYSEIFSLWAVSPATYGGLGLTSAEVGNVLAAAGAALLLFQVFVFASLAKRIGAILIARIPAVISIPLTLAYPLMVWLSGGLLWVVLISAACIKNILSVSIITGSFLLINNSVVTSKRGVANGISMTFMSLFKAAGPASAGAIFSWAETRMDASFLPGMWMVFTVLAIPACIAFIMSFDPILPSSLNKPIPEATISEAEETKNQELLRRKSSFSYE